MIILITCVNVLFLKLRYRLYSDDAVPAIPKNVCFVNTMTGFLPNVSNGCLLFVEPNIGGLTLSVIFS